MRHPRLRTAVTAAVIVAVLAGAGFGISALVSTPQRTAIAYFPTAIHVYPGSDVQVLGVKVGSVDSVTPEGTRVKVVLSYDADTKVPAKVSAVILTPTLVADRVVQLTPAYSGGPTLADGATIPLRHNEVPVELDQIDSSLVRLANALGPNGVNSHGALSRIIKVGERNLHGQGAHAHTTITRLAQLAGTVADDRKALFGTVDNLQSFTKTLAAHDAQTRTFISDLARVSAQLDSERGDFAAALTNLHTALGQVTSFVRANRQELSRDVGGLATVTSLLNKEKRLLGYMIDIGGVGVSNYPHMYTPSQRTYNARFDGNTISGNPVLFACQLLMTANASPNDCVKLLGPIAKHLPSPGSAK